MQKMKFRINDCILSDRQVALDHTIEKILNQNETMFSLDLKLKETKINSAWSK